ncbi:MAG: hypothetical protein K0S44_2337 [Bacteroidetes bacterium]|jgi:hypothetical protein|nr:hypothetical protein [Bacteroidota bacterium]
MKNLILLLFAIIVSSFVSCSNDTPKNESLVVDTTTVPADSTQKFIPPVEMVISDIPFPFEILENLHSAHVPFEQKVMNPVSNTSKYNQYNSKALNLGVFGADLAYAVTYEQFQEIGQYVKHAKKLADDLNIPFAFNQEMLDKYNKFKTNKDSLTQVVYNSYNEVDKKLKGDERVGIAALVVTGSWLEGLYLSTSTFVNAEKTPERNGLYKTIGDQKKSLGIVIKLLSEYQKDDYISNLIVELKEITSLYDGVKDNAIMNEDQLKVIHGKVEKLRKKIVEGL